MATTGISNSMFPAYTFRLLLIILKRCVTMLEHMIRATIDDLPGQVARKTTIQNKTLEDSVSPADVGLMSVGLHVFGALATKNISNV
jgi:hypothetical protein